MAEYKILLFADRMRAGGIQTLLLSLLRSFDRTQIQPELLVLDDGESYPLEDAVRALGVPVHKLQGIWLRGPADYPRYWRALDAFFAAHPGYQAVHLNSGPKNWPVLACAKRHGVPVRIAHSHNTGYQTSSRAQRLLGDCFKLPLRRCANRWLACSEEAGRWMFGQKAMNEGRVQVIPNGVELARFGFDPARRNAQRAALGLREELAVGCIGRFTPQKNHDFLLDVFAALHKQQPRSVLLLAGVGEGMETARYKAEALGIAGAVRFLGYCPDVSGLLQAMDLYLMPSFYEGYPVTGVEAQAAGLPCLFSDTVTRQVKLLDTTEYFPLDAGPEAWARRALALSSEFDRAQAVRKLYKQGCDVAEMARTLTELYTH